MKLKSLAKGFLVTAALAVTIVSMPMASVKAEETQTTYAVEKNDCLWKIAKKVYGDGDLWRVIYDANSAVIKSNYVIYTGQVLTIPGVDANQVDTMMPAPETVVPAPETVVPAPETPVLVETPAPAPNFMMDEK